jgi:hypothetical protein
MPASSLGVTSIGGFAVFGLPHRSALKLDTVSIVDKPVQNAVSDGGITDLIVPIE